MDRLAQFQNALATHHVPALAELRARPVLNQSGLPHVVAGNNALVARLRRADGADVALRIVASSGKSRDWAVRYGALGELQAERTRSRLPGSIRLLRGGFPNFDSGADGDDMAIAMEWLQGPTLLQGIDRAARGGNSSVIRALSAAFIQMWNDLQPMGFVHGDYTASNVIVRSNGQIAAVDLDTASWTDAPLGPTGQGTHGYRHPVHYRDASVRDAFAALVMITSMAALADAPALRARYGGEATTIDGPLLFSRWDLADPTTSQTFQDAIEEATPATTDLDRGIGRGMYGRCERHSRCMRPDTTVATPVAVARCRIRSRGRVGCGAGGGPHASSLRLYLGDAENRSGDSIEPTRTIVETRGSQSRCSLGLGSRLRNRDSGRNRARHIRLAVRSGPPG